MPSTVSKAQLRPQSSFQLHAQTVDLCLAKFTTPWLHLCILHSRDLAHIRGSAQ